jgi:hypothetical protein
MNCKRAAAVNIYTGLNEVFHLEGLACTKSASMSRLSHLGRRGGAAEVESEEEGASDMWVGQ